MSDESLVPNAEAKSPEEPATLVPNAAPATAPKPLGILPGASLMLKANYTDVTANEAAEVPEGLKIEWFTGNPEDATVEAEEDGMSAKVTAPEKAHPGDEFKVYTKIIPKDGPAFQLETLLKVLAPHSYAFTVAQKT